MPPSQADSKRQVELESRLELRDKYIQQNQGITRFRVQIDTTTTTQADVENNTIRGKIFLQPTKSVEFISLDFEVMNKGA